MRKETLTANETPLRRGNAPLGPGFSESPEIIFQTREEPLQKTRSEMRAPCPRRAQGSQGVTPAARQGPHEAEPPPAGHRALRTGEGTPGSKCAADEGPLGRPRPPDKHEAQRAASLGKGAGVSPGG